MPASTPSRLVFALCCLAMPAAPAVLAQNFSPATVEMFRQLAQQPNDLARYVYLVKTMPELSVSDRPLAMQMFASTEDELGLYNEAVRDFPLKSHGSMDVALPTSDEWQPANAAEVMANLATDRRIVLINEAHPPPIPDN